MELDNRMKGVQELLVKVHLKSITTNAFKLRERDEEIFDESDNAVPVLALGDTRYTHTLFISARPYLQGVKNLFQYLAQPGCTSKLLDNLDNMRRLEKTLKWMVDVDHCDVRENNIVVLENKEDPDVLEFKAIDFETKAENAAGLCNGVPPDDRSAFLRLYLLTNFHFTTNETWPFSEHLPWKPWNPEKLKLKPLETLENVRRFWDDWRIEKSVGSQKFVKILQ
eukprot:Trichotokara_eunicae@DN5706_c0_g1_i1.p1